MTESLINHQGCFDLIPDEIVVNTLSYIDVDTLLNCRLVCKRWQILIEKNVFQEKAARENMYVNNGRGYYSFSQINSNDVRKLDLEWYVFGVICKYDPFNRNLLKNHCGQDGWINWHRLYERDFTNYIPLTSIDLNNRWTIGQIPQCAHFLNDADFDGNTTCFITNTLGSHSMIQHIYLKDYGLNKTVMRTVKPQMLISSWHSNPFHMLSKYTMLVNVISRSGRNKEYENMILLPGIGTSWNKTSKMFVTRGDEYYLTLNHLVTDKTQYTLGDDVVYSFKLSCSVIKMILPIKFKSAYSYMLI